MPRMTRIVLRVSAALLVSVIAMPAQSAQAVTVTEGFGPSRIERWTVPEGVTHATFDLRGAFFGARVVSTIRVVPGETLRIYTGGAPTGSRGGFNGGGDHGVLGSNIGGSGGGGATDVRRGPRYGLADRLLVAGGGGSEAQAYHPRAGDSGQDGYAPPEPGSGGSGKAGTSTAGGAGGAGGMLPPPWPNFIGIRSPGIAGTDGTLGQGGDGGASSREDGGGGGAGGGGLYGGGGGGTSARGPEVNGEHGGGAGGSSFAAGGTVTEGRTWEAESGGFATSSGRSECRPTDAS